ncbi:UNVERIFIED_CONTAM: hypothetical protein FKN15_063348 [Acipenser sinensis]
MSVDALKKRKPKVIRNEGGTPEGKRMRGEGDQAAEMEERRMQSCIHFMTLKKLNRLAHMRLKKGRDQTHEAKQRVDALHLQLQNLLYEVMHLQKEINKCLEFKSKHEEIELVSVEEFRRDAPPEISRPEISGADPHQLTLCRLDWELEQRKRLAEKYKESLASKEKIMKSIEIKKEYLSSLQPRLTEIMQASRPVQDYLSMPFEQTQKQNEVARHLPPPLYVLLVQANAYGQACDKKLSVSIIGDVNEAKALSKPPEDSQDDESDSDVEEEQNTKRRRPTLGVQLDDKRKEMLKRHPLSVSVDLQCKAKLQAAVVLNPRYSTVPPLFSLSLSWKGERSGRTDDNLRAMEAEVNVFHWELRGPRPGYQLLTNQLQRLCMCLDVFLETESQDESVEGPREFPREKMCLRTVRLLFHNVRNGVPLKVQLEQTCIGTDTVLAKNAVDTE